MLRKAAEERRGRTMVCVVVLVVVGTAVLEGAGVGDLRETHLVEIKIVSDSGSVIVRGRMRVI